MQSTYQNAFLGSLVADAVSMPVHWYYDTVALDRDYGEIQDYQAPLSDHPDSILWRSSYKPLNEKGEILHDQAQYWGQPQVHYHQFLRAGENTLNYKLGIEAYKTIIRNGGYDSLQWLEKYIHCMQTPGWHKDTYVEEYHRGFFLNYAKGKKPEQCGVAAPYMGGLAQVPAVVAGCDALKDTEEHELKSLALTHASLTHTDERVSQAVSTFMDLLERIIGGDTVHDAIAVAANDFVSPTELKKLSQKPDRDVLKNHYSPACYLPDSFRASLFLAWKYSDNFTAAILSNARAGGDNCHRGAVVGGLVGAAEGVPSSWLKGLRSMEHLRCDTLLPSR